MQSRLQVEQKQVEQIVGRVVIRLEIYKSQQLGSKTNLWLSILMFRLPNTEGSTYFQLLHLGRHISPSLGHLSPNTPSQHPDPSVCVYCHNTNHHPVTLLPRCMFMGNKSYSIGSQICQQNYLFWIFTIQNSSCYRKI